MDDRVRGLVTPLALLAMTAVAFHDYFRSRHHEGHHTMPCGDTVAWEADGRREETIATQASALRALRCEVGHLTRMLCTACKVMKSEGSLWRLPADAGAWWAAHEADDAKRAADSAAADKRAGLVNSAMNKLTPEEREVLGL